MGDDTSDDLHVDGPGRFSHSVTQEPGATVISLTGELDVYTSPALKDTLTQLADDDARAVTFDLAGLEFVDSTGLGVLVSALTRSQELGGRATLRRPKPAIAKLLEITGLGTLFVVEPS